MNAEISTVADEMIDDSLQEDGNFEEVRWFNISSYHGKEGGFHKKVFHDAKMFCHQMDLYELFFLALKKNESTHLILALKLQEEN